MKAWGRDQRGRPACAGRPTLRPSAPRQTPPPPARATGSADLTFLGLAFLALGPHQHRAKDRHPPPVLPDLTGAVGVVGRFHNRATQRSTTPSPSLVGSEGEATLTRSPRSPTSTSPTGVRFAPCPTAPTGLRWLSLASGVYRTARKRPREYWALLPYASGRSPLFDTPAGPQTSAR